MAEEFKNYKRKEVANLRPVTEQECSYSAKDFKYIWRISVSDEDEANGSPKMGDMVARNPKNHNDKWLVAKEYFNDNFEEV